MNGQVLIYQSPEGNTSISVQFDQETVWLTQSQIAELFERERTVISKHLNKIFKEGELKEEVVCANFAHTTRHGAIKNKFQSTQVKYYNLDAIISVGYRVNSKRGTQFRQWATQRLKEYLVQGYAINEKRLAEKELQVENLKTGIRILGSAIESQATREENEILLLFAKGLALLDDYDHEQLDTKGATQKAAILPTQEDYLRVIAAMRSEFSTDIFAQPKDYSF